MEHWINWYLDYWILFVILLIFLLVVPICYFFSGDVKKGSLLKYVYTIFLVLFSIGCFVLKKTEDKISVCEEKVQEELVNNHYILSENIKTNLGANISIEKIGKDGTIYFSVGMFDDYLEGNLNKNDLKCQIVSEEVILVPDIIKCLSDHHVSLYSADFTGDSVLLGDVDGLEGITTDNQLVKVECNDNGKPVFSIEK
ncbi:TPA: hypothetical protein ACF0SI_002815 [Enterococcus hirae]